jgi:prophage regulatory protein
MSNSNQFKKINPLLNMRVVLQAMNKSKSTMYRNIENGLFPKPVKIGGKRIAFPQTEVEAIINARISGSDDDAIKQLVIRLELARKQVGLQ